MGILKFDIDLDDWYRSERRRQFGHSGSSREICECTTDALISNCQNLPLMRAYLFVASSIVEAMAAEADYAEFRKQFGCPRLTSHGGSELEYVSPDWIIYEGKGWDKLMDWSLCAQVAARLISNVRSWIETRSNSKEAWARFRAGLGPFVSTFEHYDPAVVPSVEEILSNDQDIN